MATTTALTSALTTSTISAITPLTSSSLLGTTSSLLGTVTTDLTLTSTALISQSSSTPIITATTTFSAETSPLFDTTSTPVFSTSSTTIFSAPAANSQSANPTKAAGSSSTAMTLLNPEATNLKPVTIAGIAIGAGGLILLIILASLCICLARRRKLRRNPPKVGNITFLAHSASRATDEGDLEKSRASSRTQEIDEVSGTTTPKRSMRGSTILAPLSERTIVERFSWKPQAAEHLNVSTPPENRPFSWMQQDQDVYPKLPENISPGSVPWRPASELLGQPAVRTGSPFSLPTNVMRAPPSQDSLNGSFIPGIANRQSSQSDMMLRNQIKRAFNDGARQSLQYVNSPLSDPATARWRGSEMGSIIDENIETNSRFSGETLGKLRSEHNRIQTERVRISRLQQLDEEEDWIRQQIANVETRRGSAISRAY